MYLFDSSAIINLVKKGTIKPFAYGATLDLALYEVLNAIWKEHLLLKRFDKETALQLLNIISSIFNIINIISIKGLGKEVFNLASKENITIYDASYLYIAIRNNFILITDDKELKNKALKYVKAFTSGEVVSKYKP